jgi:hypothetical protein
MVKTTNTGGRETRRPGKTPPPSFYNGDTGAIEAVKQVEAAKTEKRRATRPTVVPEPETDEGDSIRNNSGLSKTDVDRWTKAADRRGGRIAYADWRILSGIYKKASDMALDESGQKSINNPVYKKALSRIIAVLPPIADNEDTSEKYRAHLLKIERAEPEFSKWYEATQPRAVNPVALWTGFRDRDKQPSTEPKTRNGDKHQRELLEANQAAADKMRAKDDRIDALENRVRELGGEPVDTPLEDLDTVEEHLRRAWERQALIFSNPIVIYRHVFQKLVTIAIERGASKDEILDQFAFTDWAEEPKREDEDADDAA